MFDYILSVKNDKEWEIISSIQTNLFDMKDHCFVINDNEKNILLDYNNKPLRLTTLITDTQNQEIYGYDVKEFAVWTITANRVYCLNPNKNYKEFRLPLNEN